MGFGSHSVHPFTQQLGDPGPHLLTYRTESIECLLYAREWVASALVGKRVL